jgi:iron complex outermembrane recepter protein
MICIDAALALLLAAPAPAPAATEAPTTLATAHETIEVVGKGLGDDASGVPAIVTVIGGDELRARGARDLRSALASVAGVDVAPGGDGGPAGSVPEFWGLKEFDAFLLVVDDVPWGGAFNPALTTVDLEDVDRIEVLRGPAPVMYGATSFVGVLHVVHRHPGDHTREAAATFGSYGSGSGSLALSLPKWAGFDSRLSADFDKRGFRDDRTGFDRFHGLWRNARSLGAGHLGFDLDVAVVNQDPASPHVREGTELSTRTPLDANYNPDGAFLDDKRFTGTLRYDRPLGKSTWNTIASYAHTSHDLFRGFLDDLDAAGDNARGIRGEVEVNDLYFDTHLAWSKAARWKAVAGLDHLHGEGEAKGGDFDYTAPLSGSPAATGLARPVPSDDQVEDRREFTGLYGFVEYDVTKSLKLEGGLRLNRTMEEREDPREKAAAPEGEGDAGEKTVTRLSGTASAIWTAWTRDADSLRLFAGYRSAFKPAAFDFGIGEGDGGEEEGLLEPETANAYEAGLRTRLAGGRLGIEVGGFWMDFQNVVIATSVNGVPGLANGGSNRFKGIEAEADWKPREHLIVRGSYAYHDARFRDSVQLFDDVPTQLAGKRLELSSHHLAGASIVWYPERGIFGSADVHYVGSRFLNKRNTALADGYAELSARLGWRARRIELAVSARNLTDERPPVSESELGDAQYYRLPARQIEATARVRF